VGEVGETGGDDSNTKMTGVLVEAFRGLKAVFSLKRPTARPFWVLFRVLS